MPRSIVPVGSWLGLVLLAAVPGCDTPEQRECHRRVVQRVGCCPTCDAECRATVTRECAEIHDVPLLSVDAEVEPGTDSSGGEPDDDDEPRPK